jgi:2,5-diamino-6-(ribosylamino)-4(3H)-pyrimidinone 5'-phosphate reductase
MKPHVTCHTFTSLDGKIRQTIWGLTDHHKYFEEPAAKIKADAWLVGRVTMQEFSSKKKHKFPTGGAIIPKEDFVAEQPLKKFAVVIDPPESVFGTLTMSQQNTSSKYSRKKFLPRICHTCGKRTCPMSSGEKKIWTSNWFCTSSTNCLASGACVSMVVDTSTVHS